MSPGWVAPISRTRTSVRGSATSTVRGSPISLLKFPAVAETFFPAYRSRVARASLVVVLPTLPVMPITSGASPHRRVHRASRCIASRGSSTMRVGTSRGRVATAATAPRKYASEAKSAPSVRPRRAKKRSPSRTALESAAAPRTSAPPSPAVSSASRFRATSTSVVGLTGSSSPIRRNVEVAQGEAHNLSEGGGGSHLSPVGGLRFVYGYQRQVLGVGRGSEAYERGYVLVAVGAGLGVDLLGGPGLAGHGVTGNLGGVARPFVDDGLQHPAYYSRGLSAYHPGAGLRRSLALADVWCDPPSPVGDGGVARCELQSGNHKALSHGYSPDRRAAPVPVRRDAPRVLAPQVHARSLAEPEAPYVLVEFRAAEALTHLDRTHIARLCEDVPCGHDLRLVRHGVMDHTVGY